MGCIEILRLNHKDFNNFYLKYFGKIMKEAERERMNGVIPYMLSNAIIVAFFPAQIIFLSMAFLLIGDPVAAFFGASYGKYRFYNGKSLVGVAAFIIGSTIAGLILMFIFQSSYGESLFSYLKNGSFNTMAFIIIFLGGVAASLAEFFSDHALAGFLEDNLLIPIVASIVLSFLVVLFGLSNWSEIIFPITKIFS
jgi:dolichol kinase